MRLSQLLENTPENEDLPQDRTPDEQKAHDKLMKEYFKHRETKLEKKLKAFYDGDKIKRIPDRMKNMPKNVIEITIFGRRHLIQTTDQAEREKIKKLVAQYDKAKTGVGSTAGSLAQIVKTVEQTGQRTPEMDQIVFDAAMKVAQSNDGGVASSHIQRYLEKAVRTPWKEMEPLILKKFGWARVYWQTALNSKPWPALEKSITTGLIASPNLWSHLSNLYTQHVKKARWMQIEPALERFYTKNDNPDGAAAYGAATGQRVEWVEKIILNTKKSMWGIGPGGIYMKGVGLKRWPEYEKVLLSRGDVMHITEYAVQIVNARWPEYEQKMIPLVRALPANSNNINIIAVQFLRYAENIMKGNWDQDIMDRLAANCRTDDVLQFAYNVIGKRWVAAEKKAERTVQQKVGYFNRKFAGKYAKTFMGGKWPTAGIT